MTPGKRTQNFLLLGFVIAFMLVAAELTVRHIFRDITTTADNRSYFALKWKARHVRLNSLGFRDRERPQHKATNLYRIALVGDSFAFGQGIPEESRMSNIVERELTKNGHRVEVLNFGNPGNNTAAEVRLLPRILESYSPDFVLLQWYVNDVENNSLPLNDANSPRPKPPVLVRAKQWMRNKSALYFLVANVWHSLLAASGRGYSDELHSLVKDPLSKASISADQKLRQFIELTKAAGVRPGIVLVPDLGLLDEPNYEFAYLHKRVLSLCQETSTPCLDLLPAFQKVHEGGPTRNRLWVNQFDSHMGIEANAIAATNIQTYFLPYWAFANSTEADRP